MGHKNIFPIFLGQNTSVANNCPLKSSTIEMGSQNQCHQKSSDWDKVIRTVEPVDSEPDKQIRGNTIQPEFSLILHEIASLGKMHAAEFETIKKKLDVVVMKQEIINEKLNALAMAIGVDANAQKVTE